MDNAPGHFIRAEKGNVKTWFLPANVTSWKQPCDLGIIAALKKRYKFMFLKKMLDFHQLDDEVKSELKQRGRSQLRGRAGVDFGMPATLLDAANIVYDAWKLISEKTVRNAFMKADLKMNLVSEVDEPLSFDGR